MFVRELSVCDWAGWREYAIVKEKDAQKLV